MSAIEIGWQPGDPLMPDRGCGGFAAVHMTPDERAAAIASDHDTPPPWWRPGTEGDRLASTRYCNPCGVRWAGDKPCWMCGGEDMP